MKNPAATLAALAALASIALTGAAFWLSYEHLHDVASTHGLADPARAWAWPATVDLFIVIGEVLMLRAALAGRTDRWAIFLTVAGSGASIGLNVAGVGTGVAVMDYVVAAVPPVAALLAFGAIMRQLHAALATRLESAPTALPETDSEALQGTDESALPLLTEAPPAAALERSAPAPESAPEAPATDGTERPENDPAAAPEAPRRPAAERPESAAPTEQKAPRRAPRKRPAKVSRSDAKDALRALYDTLGKRPVESELIDELRRIGYPHTSRQHANKLRAEIETHEPHLAALGSDNVRALTGS